MRCDLYGSTSIVPRRLHLENQFFKWNSICLLYQINGIIFEHELILCVREHSECITISESRECIVIEISIHQRLSCVFDVYDMACLAVYHFNKEANRHL